MGLVSPSTASVFQGRVPACSTRHAVASSPHPSEAVCPAAGPASALANPRVRTCSHFPRLEHMPYHHNSSPSAQTLTSPLGRPTRGLSGMALFRVPLTLTYPIHLLQPVWQCAPMPASRVTSARPLQRNGPSRLLPCLQLTPSAHASPAGRGGHLSLLPKLSSSWLHVAGIAPTRAQVTSPAARAGCRALLGEGAGAPPHPGAGRPHLARAADAAAPPPRILTPPAGGCWGSPRGAGPFSPSFGRQVVDRRPELPACVLFASL
jgi:hypothetical protein